MQLIHLDITGKINPSSIGGNSYAMALIDYYTAKSDLPRFLSNYKTRSEKITTSRIGNIRLDGEGENAETEFKALRESNGIYLEYSPP